MTPTRTSQDTASVDHWQVVENVVAAIERVRARLPGMTVIQKAMIPQRERSRPPREVDVLVTVPVGGRNLRIAIDVKDEQVPLDVTKLEQLAAKRAKIDVDRFCVCSVSGWTAEAEIEAERNGIELTRLQEFDTTEFWAYPRWRRLIRNQVQIVAVKIIYADRQTEERARASIPSSPEQILVRDHTATAGLSKFLLHWGIAALKEFGDRVTDQVEYDVEILLPEKRYDFLTSGNQPLPGPLKLLARYRLHRSDGVLEEHRFRLDQIEISSCVVENLLGEDRQVSIAAVPAGGGGRQLVLSIGPAKPKRTKVPAKPKRTKVPAKPKRARV